MANFWYNEAKRALAAGELDLDTDDLRVILVMTFTTADTEDDVNTISGFTTLDEYDHVGYARVAIANLQINEDAANDRAEVDGDNTVFASLGVGTRQCQAAIVYKHVTNDADSVPIAFYDTGGFPFDGTGSNVTIQWNTQGILQIA
jgi:hypothetical protein